MKHLQNLIIYQATENFIFNNKNVNIINTLENRKELSYHLMTNFKSCLFEMQIDNMSIDNRKHNG